MKLVILDRDGVINEDSDSFVKSPDEWQPIPGSIEALARLTQAGYRLVVTTNQSGLQRDLFGLDVLHQIHAKMHRSVAQAGGHIDALFFCPYRDNTHHCRKPNPGMYEDVARRLRIDLKSVPVVGDALRDLIPAQTMGARPILVLTGKGQRTLSKFQRELEGIEVFPNLAAIANNLLSLKPAQMF
jgi:D-glycero-D-manno-heptose 1,7-bisphosphate phosphatase